MRFFHPFGQHDISGTVLPRYCAQSFNIVRLRAAGPSSLNLNQDYFKKVATFESAVRLGVVFTNRHQVNDARRLPACRTRETYKLPAPGRLDLWRAHSLSVGSKPNVPLRHDSGPFSGPNGCSRYLC